MNVLDVIDLVDSHAYVSRVPRNIRERANPFGMYTDSEFRSRYRFEKETVVTLVDLLRPALEYMSNRNNPISPELQVLLTLRFFATGCFQRDDGDLHGVHQTTVSRYFHKVTRQIARLRDSFIKFPEPADYGDNNLGFSAIAGFPGVIGAIDCTHIPISNPGGDDGELYRNRKGWFSINTQVVCNHKMEVISIVARWKGSTHDSRILANSTLMARLEQNCHRSCHLIGDRGYPCLPYLLTPMANAQTAKERGYNRAQATTRNIIERLFGVWKRRFPALASGLRFNPTKAATAIVAAAVLHNLAKINNDPDFDETADEPPGPDDQFVPYDPVQGPRLPRGAAKRAFLIENYF